MTRAAGVAVLALLATPALAAGDGFEGGPWWFVALSYGVPLAVTTFLAVGLGFFLQGFFRLRNVLVAMAVLSAVFWAWLATDYGFEKAVSVLPALALILALLGPLFGLGWFIGIRDMIRRSNRKLALNSGNNHG
jgi:hypothetical protein